MITAKHQRYENSGIKKLTFARVASCFFLPSLFLRPPARPPPSITDNSAPLFFLFKKWDPNFSYDTDEEGEEDGDEEMADASGSGDAMDTGADEEEEEAGDEEEEEEEEDEGDYSDEDDISWKVRTASVKCLGALIRTRPDLADTLFKELCSSEEHPLVDRFKERSESVKLEIFAVFNDLLGLATSTVTSSTGEQSVTQHPVIKYVKQTKPLIMKRLREQLKVKSSRVRLGVFGVLKKLVMTLQGGLDANVAVIVAAIKKALSSRDDQNITLKLEVLTFTRLLVKYHDAKVLAKHMDTLSKVIYERVREKYYKIIAESLRVCGELVKVVASLRGTPKYNQYVKDMYSSVMDRLEIQDIDQDVKESAINTMGLIVANLGDSAEVKLSRTLPVLVERLDNEITRLTTCKTIGVIARAKVDLSSVLPQLVRELSQYLRKSNRPLRQASLGTLRDIVKSYPEKITKDMHKSMLAELEKLVSDADLFLAHLALQLTAQIIESSNNAAVGDVKDIVFPRMLDLLESTTLQGAALESLLSVLRSLVKSAGFGALLNAVLERARKSDTVQRQVFTNIGKSVAALCENAGEADKKSTIDRFAADLKADKDQTKMLALFTLGEIGRSVDLSGNKSIQQHIEVFFDSGSEELKNAASYALGNISVGALAQYVPMLVQEVRTNQKRKYLLVHSLKEVITQASGDKLKPFIQSLVQVLVENCDNEEEGIRNVVSECLGKLALADYASVMPQLKAMLKDAKEVKRAAAISACKYTVTDQPRPDVDTKLKSDVHEFLALLNKDQQKDVAVRRAAVLLLTSIAHNKPMLIRDSLDKFLPRLYAECVFDESLIRIIKLGPFNHLVDDGLELRKSAFECMDTILDNLRDRVDSAKFVAQLPLGLGDENPDINMLTHLIVAKASTAFPEDIVQQADALVQPLAATLKQKPKDNALQQEKERLEELLASALRAVHAMSKIKGIEENNLAFSDLVKKTIEADGQLKAMLKNIQDADESGHAGAH